MTSHPTPDTRHPTPEWSVLESKLRNYLSVYDTPIPSLAEVNTIPDAPICGGGKLTIAVDGTHREVNYHLSKSDFWAVMPKPDMLFQKHHIRQAPLCRLGLTVHNAAQESQGFRHVQDMSNAEVRSELPIEGGRLNVRCLALAQRDMVVYELEAVDAVASLTVEIETGNEHDNFFIIKGHHDDATVWLRKEHSSFITVNAAMAMRAVGAGNVRTVYDKGFQAALSFEVQPGRSVRLLLSVKGGKDEYKHLEEALAALDGKGSRPTEQSQDARCRPGALPGSPGCGSQDGRDDDAITALLKDHAEWWREFWLKSWLDLGDPLLERFYYGAQYVHACSIDLDGRVTPGLAGGWITNPNPIWGGTYTMNYNGESPFWGLCSSNRGEFILPYARVCLDYIAQGRKLAKRLDTKGIVMPVMIGPWGIQDNDDALGQKSNASMAALSMIWHWESTRDREFLADVLYPYVHELMDFWEDNLALDDSGRYVIEGSARERNPGDINPGEDLAFVRRLLETAIEGSELLEADENRRDLWRDCQARLSDYPVANVDGDLCFKEAENRMKVSHQGVGDNVCAMNAVYPGGAIDRDPSGKGKIIARNTLRYLQSWNQENSFTRVFGQAVRAEWPGDDLLERFKARIGGDGEGPFEHLRRNNTFLPGSHSFEGTAPTEFINSMLAQAHGGVLKVFHVWPKERNASFERLRVRGAFRVSGELKDGEAIRLEILSEQGGMCCMQSCWPGHAIAVEQVENEGATVDVRSEGGLHSWETVPGGLYRVAVGAAVAEEAGNPPLMLVPMIEPAVRAEEKHTDADLDILLRPGTESTRLAFDVVHRDESRRDTTAACCFTVRDDQIARVSADGILTGVGRGRTVVDVVAEIDGVELACAVSVYVLTVDVLADVIVTTSPLANGQAPRNFWNSPKSLEKGYGMDGPDVTARARANSYGFGCYAIPADGGESWIQFDLGEVMPLDEMWVWNFNSPDNYRVLWWNGGTANGMRDVTIETSEDGEQWTELTADGHPFRLAKATGKQWMPASNVDDGANSPITFHGAKARYVRLTPNATIGLGNWGGERFGLSQVRFTRSPRA
ncbi:MAG: discoidin domain-containing protein [Kiritimatiellae bacterium]|nr:discoidin domain-containing protein [Kiritimatiellia bacterium]